MLRLFVAAAASALIASPALAERVLADPAQGLSVTFDTAAQTGAVMVAVYDSEAAYAGGAPVAQARVDIAGGQHVAAFPDLPAGTYAFKAFHDVDGDGRMNTNPFGMPTEPFAFSNNAVGNMGPAKWDRAHFALEGAVAQTIVLR